MMEFGTTYTRDSRKNGQCCQLQDTFVGLASGVSFLLVVPYCHARCCAAFDVSKRFTMNVRLILLNSSFLQLLKERI